MSGVQEVPDVDIAVVGGGVVGRAIAYALRGRASLSVAVVERCPRDRIENQSTRNSGVIHAGIYYKRAVRPLKARLCVDGNRMLYAFCAEHGVPHKQTGKLVVATDAREEEYLLDVLDTARENGVPDVRLIDGEEQRRLEPRIRSTRALYVPTSGVIDAGAFLAKLRQVSGSHDLFDTRVVAIRRVRDGFELTTTTETFVAGAVVNAAGLYADEIARMIDPESPYRIMAVRGEAARFSTAARDELALQGFNIYPTPHGFWRDTGRPALVGFAEFQQLLAQGLVTDTVGVHVTPTLEEDGQLATTMTLSPALVTGIAKDDFRSTIPLEEYRARVAGYLPGLRLEDLELHQTGIQGRLPGAQDWVIAPARDEPRFMNLVAIDSPGLTASLAIGEHVAEQLLG
ncbi:MAG TPA: FAD-dependent oxidoreductase [Kofleriaceae bacterium]|nr:FAD-dependent oxidoreductase [Kofleriaceae bacterium]